MADPALDKTFDCLAGNFGGVLQMTMEITWIQLNLRFEDTTISMTCELSASTPISGLFNAGLVPLEMVMVLEASPVAENNQANWVGWSKIGEAVFQQDLVNDSGYRAMDWKGVVYQILKLDKNAVVYGSGGISLLYPVNSPAPTFGYKNLLPVGILCRTAVCGDERTHYFLDKKSRLWRLTNKGPEMLGYDEFLVQLSYPVMLLDSIYNRVHICDQSNGYTLSESGLGGGYARLTACQVINGVQYYGSPAAISTPPALHLVTDIVDLGYRGLKTIESVEVGTDTDAVLQVALDYRYSVGSSWVTSGWKPVNKEGIGWIRISGVEFRIHLQAVGYKEFDVDYLNIHYRMDDRRNARGPIGGFHGDNSATA